MTGGGEVGRIDGKMASAGRVSLRYRAWEAADARAAVVVVHGLGEHAGRYEHFGSRLGRYGLSTYALDLRGHGNSDGRRGHVRSFGVFLQDLDRFRGEVQGIAPSGMPLFLLGHSMGGLIAIRYLEEYRSAFRGAIISAPWLATALPVPRWKVMAAAALTRLLPALPMHNHVDAADLSHDAAVVNAYRSDPLVHSRITPRLFIEASGAIGLALQRADRLRIPMLLLIPGADRIVDAERSLRFARQLPAAITEIRYYPTMFHEPLNEVDRHLVLRDVRDWVAARLD